MTIVPLAFSDVPDVCILVNLACDKVFTVCIAAIDMFELPPFTALRVSDARLWSPTKILTCLYPFSFDGYVSCPNIQYVPGYRFTLVT